MSLNSNDIEVTPGIYLSQLRRDDRDVQVELMKEEEIHLQTAVIPYPYTLEDADWWQDSVEKFNNECGRTMQWAIRGESQQLIGFIGYKGQCFIHETFKHRDEIGYWLGKPYWGKGIMTQVVGKVVNIGVNEYGLKRIEAPIKAYNKSSERVLEKCGFVKESTLKNAYFQNGDYLDGIMYVYYK